MSFIVKNIIAFNILLIMAVWSISPTTGLAQAKSKKRGIAFGYHTEADMAVISKGVSWWYNWYYQPESTVASVYRNYDMDFVPMAWGKSINEAGLRAYYASHPEAKFLLGFNEPNFLSQANMKPSEAAALWPKLEKIARDYGLKIVGPAVNYSGDPVQENGVSYSSPFTYLDAFFAACPNCQVDYIAVHNYMCYSGALSDYINQFKKYNKPIWLTEFACWDQANITSDMQKGLMMGAIDYLENEPMVFRYSWFNGDRAGNYPYISLFSPQTGKLTDLGQLYLNFNPVHDPSVYFNIPARLEAENYSTMSGISIEATKDVSGMANVGWIDAGDWLEYNISVPATSTYTIFFRVSANTSTNFDLKLNDVILQNIAVSSSGGWQSWKTLQTTASLSAGQHKLKVYTSKGQFNLNWIDISNTSFPTLTESTFDSSFKVYPNPVHDKLYIEQTASQGETEVSVLDITGRIISVQKFGSNSPYLEVDCSKLKNGSYLLRVKSDQYYSNQLFVKM
jgi:hypothetical protein